MAGIKHMARALCVLLLAALFTLISPADGVVCAEEPAVSPADVSDPASGILSLDYTELTLSKGKARKISAYVSGLPEGVKTERNYEWTSSDPDVAVYLRGDIKALSGGQADITCSVSLSDGSVLSAVCRVTVHVPVASVKFVSGDLSVMEGDSFVPDVQVLPEDASNPAVVFSSSDEQIVALQEDGSLFAAAIGRAVITVRSADNPEKRAQTKVTVTRRIGKCDRVLTFQGIPWESSDETCFSMLKETGFINENVQPHSSFSASGWHWPENDLLFSQISTWRTLPVVFSDRRTGAERSTLSPLKTVGGYLPQTSTLVYLNGIGADGKVDPEITRLIGVYFSFDNRHEKGTEVFSGLLARLEKEYGEFTRYASRYLARYYPDLYASISAQLAGAQEYDIQLPGSSQYLGEGVVCTMYGRNNTGIMLSMDTSGTVTLFYGRTDAEAMIREVADILDNETVELEDAGV